MPKPLKPNLPLIKRLKRHILEEPRRFFMSGIIVKVAQDPRYGIIHDPMYSNDFVLPLSEVHDDISDTAPPCGTVACIHGWTGHLKGKTIDEIEGLDFDWTTKQLGLTGSGNDLCLVGSWPRRFVSRWRRAKTPKTRAKIACDRIDYMVATGK